MKSAVKNVLCLTIITVVAGAGLGYVYSVTKAPIAQMEENTRQAAYRSVFPEAASFSEPIDTNDADEVLAGAGLEGSTIDQAVSAVDAGGNNIGYVINVTSHEGYGGDISLAVGIDMSGEVQGVEILEISETAGLGMKAKDSAFRDQFAHKNVSMFTYTKTGATQDFEIDAISGATITTKAVTGAVNSALSYYEHLK